MIKIKFLLVKKGKSYKKRYFQYVINFELNLKHVF